VQDEFLGLDYFTLGPTSASVHDFSVIQRDLTRQINRLLPIMLEEIEETFSEAFGAEKEQWKDVLIIKIILRTVRKMMVRIFVGEKLAKDEGYVKTVERWIMGFALAGFVQRHLMPGPLRAVLAPLVAVPLGVVKWVAVRKVLPLIRERLRRLEKAKATKQAGGEKEEDEEKPNDLIQWIIDLAAQKRDPRELDPWNIASKTVLFDLFGKSRLPLPLPSPKSTPPSLTIHHLLL
jgi:hypothetical protein